MACGWGVSVCRADRWGTVGVESDYVKTFGTFNLAVSGKRS